MAKVTISKTLSPPPVPVPPVRYELTFDLSEKGACQMYALMSQLGVGSGDEDWTYAAFIKLQAALLGHDRPKLAWGNNAEGRNQLKFMDLLWFVKDDGVTP